MNKLSAILIAFLMLNAFDSNSQAYNQGQKNIDITTGFIPLFGGAYYGYGFSFPIMGAVEYGASEYISVGGYLGYRTSRFKYAILNDYRVNYTTLGIKGNFHLTSLMNEHLGLDLPANELDLYGGAHFGYTINNTRKLGAGYPTASGYPQFGVYLGAKYFFTSNVGLVFEFGATPIGVANFGVTLKF